MSKLEPAFPIRDMNEHPGPIGLTLRDYFAAKAMQGLLANPGGPIQSNSRAGWGFVNCEMDDVATTAYDFADAMLAERAK